MVPELTVPAKSKLDITGIVGGGLPGAQGTSFPTQPPACTLIKVPALTLVSGARAAPSSW